MTNDWHEIEDNVLKGGAAATRESVAGALTADASAGQVLHEGLIPAMEEVGRRYERGDFFVPEILVAARVMKAALADLQPLLVAARRSRLRAWR